MSRVRYFKSLHGHTSSVSSIIYLPDKDQIVSCSNDNTLKIWDFTLDMFLTEVFCLSMIPPPPFRSDNKSNKKRKASELKGKTNMLDDNLIREIATYLSWDDLSEKEPVLFLNKHPDLSERFKRYKSLRKL